MRTRGQSETPTAARSGRGGDQGVVEGARIIIPGTLRHTANRQLSPNVTVGEARTNGFEGSGIRPMQRVRTQPCGPARAGTFDRSKCGSHSARSPALAHSWA